MSGGNGRRWPRGCARVIRDLRNGATIPQVIRKYGINHRIASVLARRVRFTEVRRDEAGSVSVMMAVALPAMIVASVGMVTVTGKMVDHRIAQGCADSAALAGAATGNCDLAQRYLAANGCGGTVSCGATFQAVATRGTASASAAAMADPVRLVE